jgi:hypothetical protein
LGAGLGVRAEGIAYRGTPTFETDSKHKGGNSDVKQIAVHEVGHQLTGLPHLHGGEATPEEKEAYEKGNIDVLRKYRTESWGTSAGPTRDQFYLCVMEPEYKPSWEIIPGTANSRTIAYKPWFCSFYEEIVRNCPW